MMKLPHVKIPEGAKNAAKKSASFLNENGSDLTEFALSAAALAAVAAAAKATSEETKNKTDPTTETVF